MGFRRLSEADVGADPGYVAFFDQNIDVAELGISRGLSLRMLREFSRKYGAS
jgi:hypothetical protein